MPRTLIGVVDELSKKITPSVNAPTKFDLYDLERSITKLTDSLDNVKERIEARVEVDTSSLEKCVNKLCEQVEELQGMFSDVTRGMDDLTRVIESLPERLR